MQTAKSKKRGYLVGFFIILGHAILELIVILLLLNGFSRILKNKSAVLFIGILGSLLLILMGLDLLNKLLKKKIEFDITKYTGQVNNQDENENENENENDNETETLDNMGNKKAIFGGLLVSASNPYWWVWWATIGFAFMINYDIHLNDWDFVAFFVGHEMGDLLWYFFISFVVYKGQQSFTQKVYLRLLTACGIFMVCFGIYLGISISGY